MEGLLEDTNVLYQKLLAGAVGSSKSVLLAVGDNCSGKGKLLFVRMQDVLLNLRGYHASDEAYAQWKSTGLAIAGLLERVLIDGERSLGLAMAIKKYFQHPV
jgi:hypothetical protein